MPSASTSPCRACRGLSPPSRQAHHHSEPDSASHGATRHAWRNRVGGGVAPAVLSHHRTYGSVYGGSGHTAKSSDRIQY
ncbi:hypothetical protein DZC76_05100 [Pseudomonas sp. phDV1]|nr:hypothetical protein DZC76_05100 [Pseudomonas sp. phDV1]